MSPPPHHQHNMLNSLRPSPLKITKESHFIHKLSSSTSASSTTTSNSSSSSSTSVIAPVIIYTRSPKVIHTQARDFMALVQKLTGLSSSRNDETAKLTQQSQERGGFNVTNNNKGLKAVVIDDKECPCDVGGISPILKPPKNPCFTDIPLFTPNTVDFFCSPRPGYRSDSAYASPSMTHSISPSVLGFTKRAT